MNKIKDIPFAGIATILFGYITLCGCLWHLGYWSTFKFNFLEYANFSDLFKSSIYPFLSNIWFLIVICIFSFGFSVSISLTMPRRQITKQVQQTFTIIPNYVLASLIVISTGIIFVFSGILFKSKGNWSLLPYAFAVFIGCIAFISGVLKNEIKDETIRLFVFISLLLPLTLNYGTAKQQSIQTQFMFKYNAVTYVDVADTTLRKNLLNSAYLGATTSHYFFFLPQRVIVVNSDNIKSIMFEERIDDQNYILWKKN